jgi:hypothetical protein
MTRKKLHAVAGRTLAVLLLAVVVTGSGRPARADNDACPGTISSGGLSPVPRTASFDVENFGNPANPLALRTKFLKWLTRAGYKASDKPDYMFAFRVEAAVAGPGDTRARQAGQSPGPPIADNTYASIGQQEHLYGLETLMFPGLRSGNSDQPNPLHINVQLRNQQNGRIVWFADLYCDLLTDDRATLVQALSVPIIANLGKTVRQEPF